MVNGKGSPRSNNFSPSCRDLKNKRGLVNAVPELEFCMHNIATANIKKSYCNNKCVTCVKYSQVLHILLCQNAYKVRND